MRMGWVLVYVYVSVSVNGDEIVVGDYGGT